MPENCQLKNCLKCSKIPKFNSFHKFLPTPNSTIVFGYTDFFTPETKPMSKGAKPTDPGQF